MKADVKIENGIMTIKVPVTGLEIKEPIKSGNELREYRYKHDLTQTELANILGVTLRTVITYEQQKEFNDKIAGFVNAKI